MAARGGTYGRRVDAATAARQRRAALEDEFGAGRLLAADGRILLGVLNYARYQALERMFGVPREHANIVTAALILGSADAAYEASRRIVTAPSLPSTGDMVLGAIALRDGALSVAGPANRQAPMLGTLIAVAMLGGAALPFARRATTRLRAAERRVREQRIGRYLAAERAEAG